MNILIVDDQKANRLMLRLQLEADGHHCIEAVNGLEGVELFEKHQPDCVLMDIMMPVMDGYLAAERIKLMTRGRHVPVIFLTAISDQDALIHCLDHGDDFLVKPVNDVLLKAKICAHGRTRELTAEIREKNVELSHLHETLQQEHRMGKHVLSHAMRKSWKDCKNVRAFLSPMSTFNGDLFLVAPNPNGGLYAFLGDMTGHGLSAAIGAVPISQVFFSMCAKARPIKELAKELNATLRDFLPESMFCAATLLQLNSAGDTIKMWTGGLPPAYVFRPGQGLVQTLPSKHVPLGILETAVFSSELDVHQLNPDDRLILLSDGIFDVQNAEGELYQEKGLLAAMSKDPQQCFESILEDVRSFSEGAQQKDDISLVELRMQPVATPRRTGQSAYSSAPWKLEIFLGPEQLKKEEILQDVVDMLPSGLAFSDARFRLQMVLTELFSNALEHGVLRLESGLKKTADGFADYYTRRNQGLNELEKGWINIEMAYRPDQRGKELWLQVSDSGPGFSMPEVEQALADLGDSTASGRGMRVVRQLSHSFEVSDSESRITVSMPLSSVRVIE